MNKKQLEAQIRSLRKQQHKILSAVKDQKTGEYREMTDDETERFEALETKVAGLEKIAEKLDAAGDDDDEDETEGEPEANGKRSERSAAADQFGGKSPAIHTRKNRYSICRALRFAASGKAPNGLEGEVSAEVRKRSPGKDWEGQFTMPLDPDPEVRELMGYSSRRDLTTSTGAGGIFNVPEMPMIELLRAKMVIAELGATYLTGMNGLFSIPRQNGKSSVNWIGGDSLTGAGVSNATLDQVPFTPKVAVDLTNITRQFINQTSISADAFVMNDLASSMAVEWDRVSINGLGSGSNQPLGILQISAIQTASAGLALGTNGGALSWGSLVNMETRVANANADTRGDIKYLTCPAIRGTLKQTAQVTGGASTFPIWVWQKGTKPGVGEVNGYEAYSTTLVPSNLSKGTSNGTLAAIIAGYWPDLVVASWDDGIDFLVNPYSNQASAAVTISMSMSVDSEVRHNESFAIITDATYLPF